MRTKLPLFPLPNVVLFPGMYLPLHIFEERYRLMMRDVMARDARFGVQLCQEYNPDTMEGKPFDIGTIAEVVEFDILADGRMNILTLGCERFQVTEYDDETKPYLVGDFTYLQDVKDGYITKKLLGETTHMFHEALRLTHKVLKKEYNPLCLPDNPEKISFYIAENLKGSLVLKQKLLEIESTKQRLQYEREVLDKMVKTLAVRTQIEEAFQDI